MTADAWAIADPTTCPVCGREACEEHLPASVTRPRTSRLVFQTAAAVMTAPAAAEVVESMAWSGNITVLVSESGTGKTFVLLDLAACVSAGLPWHGRMVTRGSVACCSYEGDALGLRLRAIHEHTGHKLEHLHFVRPQSPLSPRVTRDGEERSIGEVEICAALESLSAELHLAERPPITLIVIDTVRASLAGSEDSSEHVSAYLRAVRRVLTCVPDAAVILTHHAGWQDGDTQRKRERGSSAWRGSCDATLYLEAGTYDAGRGEAELTLRSLKVRDVEPPAPLHFIRRRVELSESTRRGDAVTSCVIESDRRSRQDREAEAAALSEQVGREFDLKTLRAIAKHPDSVTSQERLRALLAVKRDEMCASLARLQGHGWVRSPGKQREPYTLTDAGHKALEAGS